MKGNWKKSQLAGGSSYRGFELSRPVKLQYMYEANPEEIDFGSSYRGFNIIGINFYSASLHLGV